MVSGKHLECRNQSTNINISNQILSETSIETVTDAQIKLPQTFKRLLEKLPAINHKDYQLLKNSFQVRCLAKIYNDVDDELIIFDRVVGSLVSIQNGIH